MKLIKTSIAILLALAFARAASAQTTIYIAGAPATRQTNTAAIWDTLVASSGTHQIYVVADASVATSGTTATAEQSPSVYYTANQVNFYGGYVGSNPVTVKVTYNGSTAATQSLAAVGSGTSFPQPYLTDPVNTGSNNFAVSSSTATDKEQPVIGLTDTFQSTTPWLGTNKYATKPTLITYSQLTDNIVGAVPLVFVASQGAPAGLNNITIQQASSLWSAGTLPLSFFTGNNSDEGTNVYAVGRDTGSGARFVTLAEIGIGTSATTLINQYEPNVSGTGAAGVIGSGSNNPPPLYAAETVNGQPLVQGDGGYSSFTPEGTAIEATSQVGPFIGYFNTYDANTIFSLSGNVPLSYNGVSLGTPPFANNGTAPAVLAEGKYTYWSYEHIIYGTISDSTTNTFLTSLITGYKASEATILLSNLKVGRNYDGGPITLGQPY